MENWNAKIHQWFGIPYKLHAAKSGNGPTIVMLHGIATSSASWDRLLPLLGPNFQTVTVDLLGFGKSPKPLWYSYTPEEHIKSIHRTLKDLKVQKPYILVGHSLGGLLALHYVNKYPNEVERLILLSPPVYFTSAEAKKALLKWHDILYARAYRYIRLHKELAIKGSKQLKNLVLKNNSFEITEETWLPFSKSLEECIEKQDVTTDLSNVECPVDIFYGSLDQLVINSNIRKLSKYPNVRLHKIRAGHLVNNRYAQTVSDVVNE
jgi:pimeloyl-ACP methyl ester carboxylesterase